MTKTYLIMNYLNLNQKYMKYEYDKYKLIVGEKYKLLEQKYPLIVNIFFDMLFPQFLRKIWYNKKNHIE